MASFKPTSHSPLQVISFLALSGLSLYIFLGSILGRTPAIHWHYSIYLSIVLSGIFILYNLRGQFRDLNAAVSSWHSPAGLPWFDWIFVITSILSAFYISVTYRGGDFSFLGYSVTLDLIAFRIGDPSSLDVLVGTFLVVNVVEATRRSVGLIFPIIVLFFVLYVIFGQQVPVAIMQHPGVDWTGFINHTFLSTEGIHGSTLRVISTIVFLFVLFGEFSQRMGLGTFFLNVANCIAGRFAGGPAKVSVISSAFFGMISGSTVANTVATGSLTIPAMKRAGYPAHFAGAVEATASAGGQITPPLMGAAAFVMVEFLELPYTTIIAAAAMPAAMHYFSLLCVVHFQAKRLGLKGGDAEDFPRFSEVLREGWTAIFPLLVLLGLLFLGRTPQFAAAWGIAAAVAIGFIDKKRRMTPPEVIDALYIGARQALAIGAIAASVGIVIGVITLTGISFRLGFLVAEIAIQISESFHALIAWIPFVDIDINTLSIFFSLALIGIANIMMGAGVPTTALYIMLAPIAAPALGNLGVPPLAAHLFVLYYGVLADITPPVCVSAFAASGIAGSNPLRTGVQAFLLGLGKIIVPFVFVYSPAFLIVIPEYFTWSAFIFTVVNCMLGLFVLAMSIGGFCFRPLAATERVLLAFAGIFLAAPNMTSSWIGIAVAVPVLAFAFLSREKPERNNLGST